MEGSELKAMYPIKYKWTIWETFQPQQTHQRNQSGEDYKNKISKIYSFDSVDIFAKLWNTLPHKNPGEFFTKKDWTIKKFKYLYCYLLICII